MAQPTVNTSERLASLLKMKERLWGNINDASTFYSDAYNALKQSMSRIGSGEFNQILPFAKSLFLATVGSITHGIFSVLSAAALLFIEPAVKVATWLSADQNRTTAEPKVTEENNTPSAEPAPETIIEPGAAKEPAPEPALQTKSESTDKINALLTTPESPKTRPVVTTETLVVEPQPTKKSGSNPIKGAANMLGLRTKSYRGALVNGHNTALEISGSSSSNTPGK